MSHISKYKALYTITQNMHPTPTPIDKEMVVMSHKSEMNPYNIGHLLYNDC